MSVLWNWLYDWWNASKLERMRVGAALTYLHVNGEMSGCELREKVKALWFGKRMTFPQWHTVVRCLQDDYGVQLDERWTQEAPHIRSLTKFYRVTEAKA